MFSKMLNQNDQYEIAEGYYNDMRVMAPAKVMATPSTPRSLRMGKGHQSHKTGKLTPESSEGQAMPPSG